MRRANALLGPRVLLAAAMVIFGTIGLMRRAIPLGSATLAAVRGLTGMLFLLLVLRARGERLRPSALRAEAGLLIASGACLGINWILLFEAYNHTSVAVATMCYYMAPTIVLLLSPLLGERLGMRKALCALAALAGMAAVSGIRPGTGTGTAGDMAGVALGLGAAVFYAGVMLLGRRIRRTTALERTICQLGVSAAIVLPYALLREELVALNAGQVLAVAAVGVVHTGLAYALYFSALARVRAQTAALYGYIDPVVALALSALTLGERLDGWQAAGACCILLATAVGEWRPEKARSGRNLCAK